MKSSSKSKSETGIQWPSSIPPSPMNEPIDLEAAAAVKKWCVVPIENGVPIDEDDACEPRTTNNNQ